MSADDKKVPDIRFKGFSGVWEKRAFGDCFNNIPNNTLSRAELNYEHGIARNIHYGDVLIKFGEILDANDISLPFITDKNFFYKQKHATLRNGDIVIADAAEDSTVGKCTELFNVDKQIILSGLHTIAIRPTVPFASKYLGYYLNSSSYHDQLLPLMQGTKVLSISKSALQYTNINFPSKNEEQIKIGNIFQRLDNLINQHQQKHDKLSNIKKSMLEKMFPKQGETVPEIRFKGCSGEWEEKFLGDEMTITSVKRILQSDWATSGVRFLRARDIVSAYKNEKSADYLYITREKYNEYSQLSGKVEVGDLLVTGVGTIGVPMLITNNEPIYFKDGNIIWFKNENKIDGMFLYYSFIGDLIQTYIKSSAGTGTVGTYTISSGKNTPIKLPTKKEQTAIGNYFQKLDELINQHQQQITKLNHIKQACLSKMFI